MDKYYELAIKYFETFEGRHLYPKLLSWNWILWAIFGLCFFSSIGLSMWYQTWPWLVTLFVSEILFLSVWRTISRHRRKQLDERFNLEDENRAKQLKAVQRMHLQFLTNRQAKDFASIVKEIADLRSNHARFAPPEIDYLRLIYDPDAKARLISIALASCALFVALASRTTDTELVNLLEFVAHPVFGGYLRFLLLCALAIFVVGFGVYATYLESKAFISSWMARIGKNKHANELALDYFITALIEQYDPTPLDKK